MANGGRFQVFKGKNDMFYFRLRGVNHEIVAVSEAYTRKEACVNGIAAVKVLAADAAIEDQTKDN